MISPNKTAMEMLHSGFMLFPLPKLGKGPPPKNWTNLPLPSEEEVSAYSGNYGVRTGDRDLFVVDADSDEAVAWVTKNLPPTPMAVKTRRGQHFYYRARNGGTRRADKDRAKQQIDTRGVGGYVVGPNCIRDDLGDIERAWKPIPPFPMDIDACPYLTSADLLLLTGVMSSHSAELTPFTYITKGAGKRGLKAQLHESWTPPPLLSILIGVGDGKRNQAAWHLSDELIYEQERPYDIGLQKLLGWAALCSPKIREDSTKEYTPKLAKQVWDSRWQKSKSWRESRAYGARWLPPIEYETVELKDTKSGEEWQLPETLRRLPGELGHFVDYYMRTAPVPMLDLAIFSGLALGSVVASRRYSTITGGYSSMYFCTVAQSGNGKEYARKAINEVLLLASRDFLVGSSGYTSPGAFVTALKRSPNHLSYIDELGDRLTGLRKNGGELQTWAALREAWGQCDSVFMPTIYSREGRGGQGVEKHTHIQRPGVSIFGMSTPQQLVRALSDAELENGTVNRFLFNVNNAPPQKIDLRRMAEGIKEGPPESVIKWIQTAVKPRISLPDEDPPQVYSELPEHPIIVPIVDEVFTFLDIHWDDRLVKDIERATRKGMPEFYARFREMIIRLSLIIAVSIDPEAPRITLSIVEWAIQYLHHLYGKFEALYIEERVENVQDAVSKEVEKFVRKGGQSGVTRTQLSQKFRKLKALDREQVINDLIDMELIREHATPTKGRAAVGYQHSDFYKVRSINTIPIAAGS